MIVLHLGLEGCSQPGELWFVDILMYVHLCLCTHRLKTEAGEIVELPSSLEVKVCCYRDYIINKPHFPFHCQGILGTDNRRYALDLFRIFPPDPNYTPLEEEEGEEGEGEGDGEREGEGERGCSCRHKLAVLRPELLETFLQ